MKATPCRQRVANRGADVERIRSLLRLAHFIQVPIRKPGVKRLKRGADVWKLGEKRSHSDSMRQVGVWLFSNLRKRPHTKTHVHANWNPRELAGSDHNPLPPAPPLREGHHSGPNGLANSDPEPTLAPPCPSPEFAILLVSFYFFFSSAFSPFLCLLLFVPFLS